ncbi:unnamed protein product [Cochlearia groenlandica]
MKSSLKLVLVMILVSFFALSIISNAQTFSQGRKLLQGTYEPVPERPLPPTYATTPPTPISCDYPPCL